MHLPQTQKGEKVVWHSADNEVYVRVRIGGRIQTGHPSLNHPPSSQFEVELLVLGRACVLFVHSCGMHLIIYWPETFVWSGWVDCFFAFLRNICVPYLLPFVHSEVNNNLYQRLKIHRPPLCETTGLVIEGELNWIPLF